jgi:hypothetical protein
MFLEGQIGPRYRLFLVLSCLQQLLFDLEYPLGYIFNLPSTEQLKLFLLRAQLLLSQTKLSKVSRDMAKSLQEMRQQITLFPVIITTMDISSSTWRSGFHFLDYNHPLTLRC